MSRTAAHVIYQSARRTRYCGRINQFLLPYLLYFGKILPLVLIYRLATVVLHQIPREESSFRSSGFKTYQKKAHKFVHHVYLLQESTSCLTLSEIYNVSKTCLFQCFEIPCPIFEWQCRMRVVPRLDNKGSYLGHSAVCPEYNIKWVKSYKGLSSTRESGTTCNNFVS